LTAQPSTDLSLLNRVSQNYPPARVARVGAPTLSLERIQGSFPNPKRTTIQIPAPPEEWTLFTRISPQDRQEIVRTARKCEFRRCHTIHIEGDPVQQIVLLMSGCAKLVQIGQNGTEVILRLCGPGELVGTLGLASRGVQCSTAQAIRPCGALVWDMRTFDFLSQRFPELRLNTAIILCRQLKDIEDRFREISTECVPSRLSRQIMRLMNQVGRRENGAVQIDISREELAQLIGTTMYTVSRLLAEWDKKGIVRAGRGAVSVRNVEELKHLSENMC
jgi:CRP/FNR family transcriptional regulator, nitrogen oxide reductase regulator